MLLSSHQQQLCTAVPHHRAAWCIPCRPHKTDTRSGIGIKCDALAPAAAAAASALALAFLPWSGCSQGGFYATGVQGTHGKDCQAIYQPAAAAEERLAALLKQQQQQQQQIVAQHQDSAADKAAEHTATSSSTSTGDSNSTSDRGPPAAGMPSQQQLTAADQMHAVSPAAKDLVRDILQEDNRQRTKQLFDDAWQTLE